MIKIYKGIMVLLILLLISYLFISFLDYLAAHLGTQIVQISLLLLMLFFVLVPFIKKLGELLE